MQTLKTFTFMYLILVVGTTAIASITISCSNQTGKINSQFLFSYSPLSLVMETSYDGTSLPPYIFLNDKVACGQPLQPQVSCSIREFKDAIQPGDYDFRFSCSDGRRGELHYENGTVMAYCYRNNTLANQRGWGSCSISF